MASAERPSVVTHLKRALGWNLARVELAPSERERLEADGVTSRVVQRYAAWRRSLLQVAVLPTVVVLALALLDAASGGFEGLSVVSLGLEAAWFAAMVALLLACTRGIGSWTRPGTGARLLVLGWAGSFLIPIVYALLPASVLYVAEAGAAAAVTPDRFEALIELVFELVLSSGAVVMLLPAVISIIPGLVNGCLRVKSLVPAAQLPGWLLVCASPMFLLFWLVLLVLANQALRSPLLVLGVLLWAGSPIWYALRGRIFVTSHLDAADATQIGRVKRVVTVLALAGIALIVTALVTTRVAGMALVGLDEEGALTTRIAALVEVDEDVSLGAVEDALETATSLSYGLDVSAWQLLVDILAKLLLTTAVFAHLVLRATLSAWSNDRALRAEGAAATYDEDAASVIQALAPPAT